MIASASEDCTVKIWKIPEFGLEKTSNEALLTLNGHERKVVTANFNPVVSNVLASASTDLTVRIWEIEIGEEMMSVKGHKDYIYWLDWNYEGSLIGTYSYKKINIVDPRMKAVCEVCFSAKNLVESKESRDRRKKERRTRGEAGEETREWE